jgi:hypothetical protein
MIHIEIEAVWRFKRDDDPHSVLVMLDFLNEIRVTGKIGGPPNGPECPTVTRGT